MLSPHVPWCSLGATRAGSSQLSHVPNSPGSEFSNLSLFPASRPAGTAAFLLSGVHRRKKEAINKTCLIIQRDTASYRVVPEERPCTQHTVTNVSKTTRYRAQNPLLSYTVTSYHR